MQVWTVRLLGVPGATCGERQARLRSKETWAVLASLLLPGILHGYGVSRVARETLADRFWGESQGVEPRTHLRQALASLRQVFGEDCLEAERDYLQATPGRFITDIELALTAYKMARSTPGLEEGLFGLLEAEGQIRGEFFEGWSPRSIAGEVWLLNTRADVWNRLLPILMELIRGLEATGNDNGALEIVRRVLQLHPGHGEARALAWKLAARVGQTMVLHALEQAEGFQEAVARLKTQSPASLTVRDRRLFQSLFQAQFSALPIKLQKPFLRLAVLPAPFPAEVAKTVSRVSRATLNALAQTPLLEREQDTFTLLEVIRTSAWRQLPTATRRQLQKRQANYVIELLSRPYSHPTERYLPFRSSAEIKPFLTAAVDWLLQQQPAHALSGFFYTLQHIGFQDLALRGIPYLDAIGADETASNTVKAATLHYAGHLLLSSGDFEAASQRLQRALDLRAPEARTCFDILFPLALAQHYGGDSTAALESLQQALQHSQSFGEHLQESDCLRVLCEIQTHLGDYEAALQYSEQALTLRQQMKASAEQVADAQFWKGLSLFRVGQSDEAIDTVEEALALWQKTNDTTGIGHCLRLLGQIRAGQGRTAEAIAHLEHAILLHERKGDQGSRIAALVVLGNTLEAVKRTGEAVGAYEACLAYYAAQKDAAKVERIHARMRAIQARDRVTD